MFDLAKVREAVDHIEAVMKHVNPSNIVATMGDIERLIRQVQAVQEAAPENKADLVVGLLPTLFMLVNDLKRYIPQMEAT